MIGAPTRFVIRETLGVATTAALLVGTAGDSAWTPGWAAVGLTAAWSIGTTTVILRGHPDLLAERLTPRRGSVTKDVLIVAAYGVVQLGLLTVAGLDHRLGWTTTLPAIASLAGFVLAAIGHGIVVWATASNAWFSQVLRIQSDRGHQVARGGPYRFVRHPAYAGSVLTSLGLPLLLGSVPALALGLVGAALMVLRAAMEDRTLRRELPGYGSFAISVPARVLPGVW